MKHLLAIGASVFLCALIAAPFAIETAVARDAAPAADKSKISVSQKAKSAKAATSKNAADSPKASKSHAKRDKADSKTLAEKGGSEKKGKFQKKDTGAEKNNGKAKKEAAGNKNTAKKILAENGKDSRTAKIDKNEFAQGAGKKKIARQKDDAKNMAVKERDVWLKRARASETLSGKASWYGKDFHNKATASGLAYDMYTFTAAHRTLPLGTVVKVTDQKNGKSVMVCVTDRGPYVHGRIIDLSYAAASRLDLMKRGVGKVQLEVVSDERGEPLKKDHAYFVRYASGGGRSQAGPFNAYADAAAMHEALRQAHPEAEVILAKVKDK